MRTCSAWGTLGCLSLLLVICLSAGCSQEASFSPPFDLNAKERFRDTTLLAIDSDWAISQKSAGPGWSSQRLVVANWRGYEARSFIRFTAFPDSNVQVLSAMLYLYAPRIEGETGGAELSVYTLVDTLKQSDIYWGTMPGLSPQPVASFQLPAQSRDSMITDVTEAVTGWIKGESLPLGFAIRLADEVAAPEVMVELASREVLTKQNITDSDTTVLDLRPALRIAYVDTAGEMQKAVSIAAEDVFADTLLVAFAPDSLSLFCGNGYPSRCFVRFDISNIPVGSTVVRSVLRMWPHLEASSFDSMGVICHAMLSPSWLGLDTRIGASGTGQVTLKIDEIGQGAVEMVVTPLIQPLVARRQNNYGLVLKSPDEKADLDFVSFFSSANTDTAVVPKLSIDYVLPPDPPYTEEDQP